MFGPFIVFRILKIFILEMIYYSLHFIIAYKGGKTKRVNMWSV